MPALKIQVGVGLDANPAAAFASAVSAAKAATAKINAEFANVGKRSQGAYRTAAQAAEQSSDAQSKAAEKAAKNAERAWTRFFERQRQQRAAMVAEEKAAAQKAGQEIASNAGRYMVSGLRTAGRFAMDIARGAGVNLDIGSLVGKSVSMEKRAVDLANASIGTGVAGSDKRVPARELVAQARNIGQQMGFDPEAVLEGLQKYVAKTGDLATGRSSLPGLAKLASATGSDLADVVDAAGDVANALGDIPGKGKAVESVMRAIAGQGKVGAVEMKDLAVQMAKLGAAAGAFGGDKAKTIESMGILAQLARATGGAASASQATTSVARFVSTLQTPARLKEFFKAGVKKEDIYDAQGGLRDPFEIIKLAIARTGADPIKLHGLFASTVGNKPVDALAKVYRDAGGGQKGMAAIDAELKRLQSAAMTDATINEAHAERMKTSAAKIEQFNAKMVEVGASIAEKVLPALEKAGPGLIRLGESVGTLIGWIAQNPKESVGLLIAGSITASIAKAAIGDAVGKSIGSLLGGIGPTGAALGVLALAAVAAAAAIADYESKVEKSRGEVEKDPAEILAKAQKELKEKGTVDKDTMDALARARADVEGSRASLKTGGVDQLSYTQLLVAKVTGGADQLSEGEGKTAAAKAMGPEKLDALASKMDALIGEYRASQHRTMDVRVTNMPNGGNPVVDQSNRTP